MTKALEPGFWGLVAGLALLASAPTGRWFGLHAAIAAISALAALLGHAVFSRFSGEASSPCSPTP